MKQPSTLTSPIIRILQAGQSYYLLLSTLSAACLVFAGSLNAGTFTTDFGTDPGTSIVNKPEITTLVRGGILKLVDLLDLNDPDTGQFSEGRLPLFGSYILPEIDSGQKVASFTATFKARVGGGTESSALGFSLVLANDFDTSVTFRESGGATTGLTISFDSIDGLNDGASEGNDPGDAPGIIIKQKGQKVIAKRFAGLRTDPAGAGHDPVFVPIEVKLTEDGLLSVTYNTNKVYENVPIGYIPIAGQFGFGSGTENQVGAVRDNYWIDDVSINTTTVSGAYVVSVSPPVQNAPPDTAVSIGIQDLGNGAVQMVFDGGTPFTPTKTDQGGGLTSVKFTPAALLAPGSTHTVNLTYAGKTFQYGFTVANAALLPSNAAAAAGSVDTTKTGFKVRVHQVEAVQTANTADRAERQLAGDLGPNTATSGPNADGTFDKDLINFDADGASPGDIAGDETVPGIPGSATNPNDNVAMEVLGFLDLAAGSYTIGAVSDDSIKFSIGAEPRDVTALVLFDVATGRATGPFIVQQAGIYPFRALWTQGTGAASLELWNLNAAGIEVLLNDSSKAGFIKSYRQRAAGFQAPPYLSRAKPGPSEVNVSTRPKIELGITDDSTTVNQATIKLSINDALVTIPDGAVTKSGKITTIKFDLSQTLPINSLQKVKLEFADSAGKTIAKEYSFTTGKSSGGNVLNAVKGYWSFDNGNLKAGVGRDLEYVDAELAGRYKFGTTGQGDFATVPLINGKPAKVVLVPYVPSEETDAKGAIYKRLGLRMKHDIAPNGGGKKVNQYTVILDLLWGENASSINYGALWQLHDLDNPVDSDMYWQGSSGHYGKTGASDYAPGTVKQERNEWARVAFAVDLAANPPILAKYINGVKNLDQITGTRGHVDSEFAMSIPEIVLFGDSDNEQSDAFVNAIQVREGRMSDEEVAALGGPDPAGIPLPYSQWEFNDPAKPLAAAVGNDLTYVDASLANRYKAGVTGQGDFASVPLINGKPANVFLVPYVPSEETDATGAIYKRLGLRLNHGLAPNGGGKKVNQYTVILDLLWGENASSINYGALWQLHDLDNPVDSDMYWQGSSGHYGKTGGSDYAPGTVKQERNEWARVAFAVDLAANPPILAKYINGIKNLDTITGTRGHVDSEFAFSVPEIVLFGDSDNEQSDAFISSLQVRQGRMSDEEVAALGGPDAAGIPTPNPVKGEWNFDDPANPLAATIGNSLTFVDPSLANRYKSGVTGQGDFANVQLMNGKPVNVFRIPYVPIDETDATGLVFKRIGLRMKHGVAANGGGAKVNQYTVILDLLWGPEPFAPVNYGALWQLHDLDNPVDSDMYWQGSSGHYGKTGASDYAPGTAKQERNEWARVVFAVDLAANPPLLAKYINGIKNLDTITGTRGHVDSEFAMSIPEIILFGDSDDETSDAFVSAIQVREGRMSDEDVAALGGPDAAGIPSASIGAVGTPTPPPTGAPPELLVSRNGLSLTISWDAAVTGFVLEETGSLSSPVTWTATPGVANNSVTVQIGVGNKYYRSRKQ